MVENPETATEMYGKETGTMMKQKMTDSRRARKTILLAGLVAGLALEGLSPPHIAWGACVCGYGDGRMTINQNITIDGDMGEWSTVLNDIDNNICDAPPGTERDGNIQSTGRDLMQFAYTWDSSYVFAYTERLASDANVDNFIYYADANNNGLMETGETVIVAKWKGSNRNVDLFLGKYSAANGGGDPMVNAGGFADGYKLPGTITDLNPSGQPNYSGSWGSDDGVRMEWRVSWSDLGIPAGTAFSFHVSSTNATPGSGSFPAQVDDNMGGCGGGAGSSQYAGLTFAPNRSLQPLPGTTVYAPHVVTNTGNGTDRFELTSTIGGGFTPTVQYYRDTDGNGAFSAGDTHLTDTDGDGKPDTGPVPAGNSFNILIAFTIPGATSGTASVTTTATSGYDSNYGAVVTDTLALYPSITIRKLSTGGAGSFTFINGTNGLPASLTLDTSGAGNNPKSATPFTVTTLNTAASLTETVPAGWFLSSADCVDGAGNPVAGTALAGSTLTIPATAVIAGESLTCTFNNSAPGAGLVLVKTVDKAAALPGDTLTYTITYSNNGLVQLSNIIISDSIPTYTSSPSACCVNPSSACLGTPAAPYPSSITGCTTVTTSASASWNLSGTLAPGASGQVKLSVTIQQ